VARIDPPLQNDGTVTAASGTLQLAGGGGASAATGTYGAPSAGGTINFSSGTLGGSGTFEISGSFGWAGGTMNTAGGTTRVMSGATLTQTNSVTLTSRLLEVASGGTFELAADVVMSQSTA